MSIQLLGRIHPAAPRRTLSANGVKNPDPIEIHPLPDGGWCPNNPACPVLVYRGMSEGDPEAMARSFEETFAAHGWPPAWRYTIFDYPHYHSTSHEVIGVFRGSARIRLGDTVGLTVELQAGDVVLIPAGVSHQRLNASDDFQGVGAYPTGCKVDEQRKEDNDREGSDQRIAQLKRPKADPLFGGKGPLLSHWQ